MRVATMPTSLQWHFLDLLTRQELRAMALLGRNLALVKGVDDVW